MQIPQAHTQTTITPGKYYRVMCAVIQVVGIVYYKGKSSLINKSYLLPIQGPLHFDKKFGVPQKHYHIDGRFNPVGGFVKDMHRSDGLNGLNNNGVFMAAHNMELSYKVVGVMPRILKAVHPTTGLNLAPEVFTPGDKYATWYQSYIGKEVVNGLCPHNKVQMQLIGGHLVCPLHALHACPHTNKIIPHPLEGKQD
jgi:hypothetical protein